jgi:putative RNA 2'-phosphotransferase
MANLQRLSTLLALMLRHKAHEFGLTLDSEGFTDTDAVWAQIEQRYPGMYSRDDLLSIVAGDETGKRRYEIVGTRIRALFGHGAVTPVSYPAAEPPDKLYHGTTQAALDSICKQGLQAGKRQYVHLTSSERRARTVAGRHSRAIVVLTIRAAEAHRAGVVFHQPEAEHWLVRALPPEFIDLPTPPPAP